MAVTNKSELQNYVDPNQPTNLLSGRNVRWSRRMLPLVNHGEYADGTDRQTDRRAYARPLHYAFR